MAVDGNFRLKRRMVSSDERDPGLNEGWAYFVEDKAYRTHLASQWDMKQEVCTLKIDRSPSVLILPTEEYLCCS